MEFLLSAGYLALFVGTIFEGEIVLVSAGMAVQQGYLSWPLVVLSAWIGSITGDHLFYALGRYKGNNILSSRPSLLLRVQGLFGVIRRHQALVILCIRFMCGLRMVMPFTIGTAGVRLHTFAIFDACSGLIWAGTFAAAGYGFGAALTIFLADPFERVAVTVAVSALVAVILLRIVNRKLKTNTQEPAVENAE